MELFRPANIAKVVLAIALLAAAIGYVQAFDERRTGDRPDRTAEAPVEPTAADR